MTKYRIVEVVRPTGSSFYVEYREWFSWTRVVDLNLGGGDDWVYYAHWPTLEAARDWIAAKQAAQRPCVTIIHQP